MLCVQKARKEYKKLLYLLKRSIGYCTVCGKMKKCKKILARNIFACYNEFNKKKVK